jgi:hypothetical protein
LELDLNSGADCLCGVTELMKWLCFLTEHADWFCGVTEQLIGSVV